MTKCQMHSLSAGSQNRLQKKDLAGCDDLVSQSVRAKVTVLRAKPKGPFTSIVSYLVMTIMRALNASRSLAQRLKHEVGLNQALIDGNSESCVNNRQFSSGFSRVASADFNAYFVGRLSSSTTYLTAFGSSPRQF